MKLYEYNTKLKEVGASIKDHTKIHFDELYILRGAVEHVNVNGKEVTLVDEMETEKGVLIITDEKGNQPFAAFTNDSERDVFRSNEVLARNIVRDGHHIILGFYPENDVDPIDLYVFRVETAKYEDGLFDSVLLRCIRRTNTLVPVQGFENATEHIINLSKQSHLLPQLKNKYCFQTTRKVMFCFMSLNERGDVISEREKRMILNTNSRARLQNGEVVKEGIFRVYYSRRFKNSDELYVEGVRIPDEYLNIDIEDFINSTNIDVIDTIRVLTTKYGNKIYALLNNKGEIRPIINLGGYKSFAMSDTEIRENIVSIDPYR